MARARSGKTITIVLGALALLLAGGFLATSWESILDWWHRIPVTRTWADLMRARPIELDEDGETRLKVRLGVERTRCPAGGGLLVYGLVDGALPVELDGEQDRLGPLRVRVQPVGGVEEARLFAKVRVRHPGYATFVDRHLFLFLRTVPIPRPGEYRISVLSADGKELRWVHVQGTDEPFQPWLTFGPPSGENRPARPGPAPDETIELRPSIAAVPDWQGLVPLGDLETQAGLDQPETPLPGLWPDDATPRLGVTVTPSGELDLVAPQPIRSTRMRSRLLARVWVAGRPYPARFADLDGTPREQMEIWTGREVTTTGLRLDLLVDRAALGATPDERVELQLLYLERGWRLVGPELERLSQVLAPNESARLVSDRVELPLR